MENIQDEVMKIHHKYGTTEMANYQIQLLFDRNYSQLQTRIKELEATIENINNSNNKLLLSDVRKSVKDYKKKLDLNNSWHRERLRGVLDFLSTVC